jgi:hypothetical protein
MRIPIRVRQFPRLLRDLREKRTVLARPLARQPRFFLCFFSCHSYYRYLACALHSLVLLKTDVPLRVLVFNDRDMPMSREQIDTLMTLGLDLSVIDWPKSVGWTVEQIDAIWRAYALAIEGAQPDDWVGRVDADVFFFNDTIFKAAARSDADLVGDGHFVEFGYSQGGCYFFRVSAARTVLKLIGEKGVERLARDFPILVEDVAATHMARSLGLKVWLTWFMMFPDELRHAGGLGPRQHEKFSCIHFVMKNKAAMLEAYERDVLSPAQVAPFRQLLDVG